MSADPACGCPPGNCLDVGAPGCYFGEAPRIPRSRPDSTWVDLFGIDPDFTGGKDVNEYLDEMRGDA